MDDAPLPATPSVNLCYDEKALPGWPVAFMARGERDHLEVSLPRVQRVAARLAELWRRLAR
jgi:hypothetical protein